MAMSAAGLITAPSGTAEIVNRAFDTSFLGVSTEMFEKQKKQIRLSKLTDAKARKLYEEALKSKMPIVKQPTEQLFTILDSEYQQVRSGAAKPARLEANFKAKLQEKGRTILELNKQENHEDSVEPISVSTAVTEEPQTTTKQQATDDIILNAEALQDKINTAFAEHEFDETEEVTRVLPSSRGVKVGMIDEEDKKQEVTPLVSPREPVLSVTDMKRDAIDFKQEEKVAVPETEFATTTVEEEKGPEDLDILKETIAAIQLEVEQGKVEVAELHTSVNEEKLRSEQAKASFNGVKEEEDARKQALEQARLEQQAAEEEKKKVQQEVEKTTAEVKRELLKQKEEAEKLKAEVQKQKEQLLSERANAQQEQEDYEIKAKTTQAEISELDNEYQKVQDKTQMTREEILQMQLKKQEIRRLVDEEDDENDFVSTIDKKQDLNTVDGISNSSIFDQSSAVSVENEPSSNPEIDKLMDLLGRGTNTDLYRESAEQKETGGRTR